ncbi:hypothetical protein E1B28_008858 [Marasmius oreades]|uniref:SAP domain-containing protein n=1 Tax=Marasmius oreades TaxID=181124 RepID=A0A9P7US65_9AGAR|nr:uncharacterized protein E1B28_008858 [Marasmius oreades]KAG7092507.1 hypothetical protein E1B28_008858 [Marasmius oreades]
MQLVIRPFLRTIPSPRSFVSTVLLNRPLDQLTVADLKKEARSRGLSPTGNKANLLLRIQDHEKSLSSSAILSQGSSFAEAPAPGIPAAKAPATFAPERFHVIIPDASYEEPEPPIQVPYVPDFWSSSSQAPAEVAEGEENMPKLIVVAGTETHAAGGPSHMLLDALDEATPSAEETPSSQKTEPSIQPGKGGLLDDMAEDLGLPYPNEIKKSFWKFFS